MRDTKKWPPKTEGWGEMTLGKNIPDRRGTGLGIWALGCPFTLLYIMR
jgi:hypothetical protein